MPKNPSIPPIDRVCCALLPTGIVWADRTVVVSDDYKVVARMPYDTLELQFEKDCPAELRREIVSQSEFYVARRGEQYRVTSSGQTVLLGSALKSSAPYGGLQVP